MRAPHPWLGHPKLQKEGRLDFLGPIFFLFAWFGALCMFGASQMQLRGALSMTRRSKVSTRVRRGPPLTLAWSESFNRSGACYLNYNDGNPVSWRKPDGIGAYDPGYYPALAHDPIQTTGTIGMIGSSSDEGHLVGGAGSLDVLVEVVSQNNAPFNSSGPEARVTDSDNQIYLGRTGSSGAINLYKRIGGTFTNIGPSGGQITTAPVGTKLGLKVEGDVITVFLDGTSVYTTTITDPILRTGSLFGCQWRNGGNNSNYLDDLKVYRVNYNRLFSYTGSAQTIVVPTGVNSAIVDLYGAEGATSGGPGNRPGGKGGRLQATIPVTPGETLQINVGGTGLNVTTDIPAGGWNGGGDVVANGGQKYGTGGGGATDIRRGGTALANRVVVAGGGGGSGYTPGSNGGDGGGVVAGAGLSPANAAWLGSGGTQSAGGARASAGGTATAGALGQGGSASYNLFGSAGGGGGGYYGGGGGYGDGGTGEGGGGGGGSSYTDSAAGAVTHTQGARAGNGLAVVTFVPVSTTPVTSVVNRGHLFQDLGAGTTTMGPLSITAAGGGTLCMVLGITGGSQESLIGPTVSGLGGTWVQRGVTHEWPGSSTKAYLFTCTNYTPGTGSISLTFTALPNTQSVGFVVDEVTNGKTVAQAKAIEYGGNSGNATAVSLDVAPSATSLIWGYFFVGLHNSSDPRVSPDGVMTGLVDLQSAPATTGCWVTGYKLGTSSTPGTLNFDMSGGSSSNRHCGIVEIAA